VETLFPVFGLSDAAIRGVVIVLAIGFMPMVVVAWVFELTPEGLVRDSEVNRGSAAAKASTRRLDRIAMVALALAVVYFAFDKFMLDPARDQAIAEAAKEQGRAEALQDA
jgi:formate hydrogenlyase subunit 3/multisubunit Na+/H+ antiporter MnhD subunit